MGTNCVGDCDTDKDCQTGLKCFQRNGNQRVPGCLKGGIGDMMAHDYCYKPRRCKDAPTYKNTNGRIAHTKCSTWKTAGYCAPRPLHQIHEVCVRSHLWL